MKRMTDMELQARITRFMDRKSADFPELFIRSAAEGEEAAARRPLEPVRRRFAL